ncbi:hypothetical protein D3C76_1457360 [compost metagenome]
MVLMRVPVHGFISVYVIEWDGVGFFICRYCVVSPCVASMRHIQQGLDALVNIDYAKSRNLTYGCGCGYADALKFIYAYI